MNNHKRQMQVFLKIPSTIDHVTGLKTFSLPMTKTYFAARFDEDFYHKFSEYGIWEMTGIFSFLVTFAKAKQEFKNPIFIDIGAHYGYLSCLVADLFPDTKVYAFEPNPKCIEVLKVNQYFHPSIKVLPYGISDKKSIRDFSYPKHCFASGSFVEKFEGGDVVYDKIECRHINSFNIDFDRVVAIKIDVQGDETTILKTLVNNVSENSFIYLEPFTDTRKYIDDELYWSILQDFTTSLFLERNKQQ